MNEAVYQQAMRWLTRREYSAAELRQRLLQKKFSDEEITAVIEFLITQDYLSHERFVDQLVQNAVSKLNGPRWIHSKLQQHDIKEANLDQVYRSLGVDWPSQAARLLAKRKISIQDTSECYRCLWQKGYTDVIIHSVLSVKDVGNDV